MWSADGSLCEQCLLTRGIGLDLEQKLATCKLGQPATAHEIMNSWLQKRNELGCTDDPQDLVVDDGQVASSGSWIQKLT